MAYLILRIEPLENETTTEKDCLPIIEKIAKRHRLEQPGISKYEEILNKAGYEMCPHVGPTPKDISTYDLMAYGYVSNNKEGIGRVASSIHRLRVRHQESRIDA